MAIDSGSTAFIIVSMALVNLMTPGLAFFYGGLVREKNVLTILMQNFVSMGLVTIIWVVWGFSLCFGESGVVIGNPSSHAMLTDMYKWDTTIPGLVFAGSSPSPPWAPTPSFPSPFLHLERRREPYDSERSPASISSRAVAPGSARRHLQRRGHTRRRVTQDRLLRRLSRSIHTTDARVRLPDYQIRVVVVTVPHVCLEFDD